MQDASPSICLPPSVEVVRVHNVEQESGKSFVERAKRYSRLLSPESSGLRRYRRQMLQAVRKAIVLSQPAVAISTSGPELNHWIAAKACRESDTPWVADFRDIAEQWASSRPLSRIIWAIIKRRQNAAVSNADALVTVSGGLADTIERRSGRRPVVIPNGFDEDLMQERCSHFPSFTITFTGTVYDSAVQDGRVLFNALQQLFITCPDSRQHVSVRFIGTEQAIVDSWIAATGFCGDVKCLARMQHSEALKEQARTCVLLHLAFPGKKGILTGKIFDYLGAGRPILSIPADNDCVESLLKETNAGVSCRNADETAAVLKAWYLGWRETGTVDYMGDQIKINKYTRREETRTLAELLNTIAR